MKPIPKVAIEGLVKSVIFVQGDEMRHRLTFVEPSIA